MTLLTLLAFMLAACVGGAVLSPYMFRVSGSSMLRTYHDGDLVHGERNPSAADLHADDVIVFADDGDWTGHDDEYLIKRIIATPGDVVGIDMHGRIHVNGRLAPGEDGYDQGCAALEGLASDDDGNAGSAEGNARNADGGNPPATGNGNAARNAGKGNRNAGKGNAVMVDGMGTKVHDSEYGNMMRFTVPDGKLFVRGDNLDVSSDSRWMYCNEGGRLGRQGFLVDESSVSLKVDGVIPLGRWLGNLAD